MRCIPKHLRHTSRHYVLHVPFWMCYKREQKHIFVDRVCNCLPVPSFGHFLSQNYETPEGNFLSACETPQVKMIRLWEHCALEGICLACILFGLFLPYGLINNARWLKPQLQWWRHQNAKQDCALLSNKTRGPHRLLISGLCIPARKSRLVCLLFPVIRAIETWNMTIWIMGNLV